MFVEIYHYQSYMIGNATL
uniref:Uncharacterized protein n=1 Tax=Arundo donax TaxID=35708 RepID=A0A0A9AAN9_ARUDO